MADSGVPSFLLVRIAFSDMIHFPIDHDAGAYMSTIETVIFWLAVFWTPSLAFAGYLLLPRRPDAD